MVDLVRELKETAKATRNTIDRLLKVPNGMEKRVVEAMRYSVLAGGKALRPFMVLESAKLFDVEQERALRVAAALEMVHCYSLIHDDLPAMDNDDMRRGQPTCHKQFDEATAILAGDGLLTRAFGVISSDECLFEPQIRCKLIHRLAKAAGMTGMIGGQMMDILAETEEEMKLPDVIRLQELKTGCLFSFACESGAVMGKGSLEQQQKLRDYARHFGLAFQIADDILDVEGDANVVGKAVRKDLDAHKATFISLLGLEKAKEQARLLSQQAVDSLAGFDGRADNLRELARYIVDRKS
ncbi:MAG: polyprenyl synthetase family protein [Alphaproteobacteria bacterium]|nr:polyprenyl synthetase family protein [Alphaproteobacteria bacterium]